MINLSRHNLVLSLCVGIHFAAVTFLLPLLPRLGDEGPWFEAAFYLAHIAALPILGRLADRFGTRTILAISLAGEACAFGLLGLSRTTGVILAARVLAGASSAVLPVCFAWVRHYASEGISRERGIAALMIGISLGAAAGSFVSGAFAENPIWLAAGLGSAAAIFGVVLAISLPLETRRDRTSAETGSFSSVIFSRELATMALVFLFVSTGFFLFRTLLPFRLTTPLEGGALIGALSLIGGVSQIFLLLRTPKKISVYSGYAASIAFIALCFFLALINNRVALTSAIVLLAVGFGTADVLGGSVLAGFTKEKNAGEASGTVFGIGALGKIIGPSLAVFFTADRFLIYGAILPAMLAALSFLLLLSLTRKKA